MRKQQCLKQAVTIVGKGLHSGIDVELKILAAEAGHGIQFQRMDLPEAPVIKADAANVFKTDRHTVIGDETAYVATVEHLMAAFYALGIDNALVEINAAELPILDGSAQPFIEAFKAVGLEEQAAEKPSLKIKEPISVQLGESEISIYPAEELEVMVTVDFQSAVLPAQFSRFKASQESFEEAISPARTFVFLHELSALLQHGLAKGGQPDSALVFVEQLPTAEQKAALEQQYQQTIDVQTTGLLPGQSLRYNNEAARHKLLDLMGDLALLGFDIVGRIVAHKPGHGVNNKMALALRQLAIKERKTKNIPVYDPKQEAIYTVEDIFGKLQHRYPFLLIDKIIDLSPQHVVAVKNVTFNEPFFVGHFPGHPIMPGVLQIEAMAQTGGILVMEAIEDPLSYDTYFLKIDKARFRRPVVPGDTLIFRLDLMRPIRRGLVEMQAKAYVGDKLVAEAELLAQIIKRK